MMGLFAAPLNAHVCICVCVAPNKSYVQCVCVCILLRVPCLHKYFGPLCFSSECLFQAEQNERHGEKARGRERERPRCIPISLAHWGRTVPKILGLRWSPLRPPISNSQSLQSNAIQIITNGVRLDGYVQHDELLKYTARLLHIKVVTSGTVKCVCVCGAGGVECRLSWAGEDFYVRNTAVLSV